MNHTLFHRIVLFALTAVGLFALVYLCLFAWVCYAESHLETPPETVRFDKGVEYHEPKIVKE